MIKFIICEDKSRDLERAKVTINRAMVDYNVDYRIYCYDDFTNDVKEHIESNEGLKIFILDVELNKTSGIEIGSVLRESDWRSYIIFVTSHPEYKNDVFYARLLAFDYISKYYKYEDRLKESVKKIVEREQNYEVLKVSFGRNEYVIPFNKIVYFEKENSGFRIFIHVDDGEIIKVVGNLTAMMKRLSESFYRTHQSCIINLDYFKVFDVDNCIITFKNGMNTNLFALKNKKEFKDLLRKRFKNEYKSMVKKNGVR